MCIRCGKGLRKPMEKQQRCQKRLAVSHQVQFPMNRQNHFQKAWNGMEAEFRSLVGVAMYISQQCFGIQSSVKTLASILKHPAVSSWRELAKLIGYLKQSEN